MLAKLWENEKQRLLDILLRRVSQGNDKVNCNDIVMGKFPEVFQVCLRNYARKLFDEEKPLQLSSQARYNFQSEHFKKYFEHAKEALIGETLFTEEEIKRLAKISVSLQFDALVRPRQTIIEVLFNTTNQRDKEDVLTVIRGFDDNRPFIQRLIGSIENLDAEIITRKEVEELTKRSEKQVYNEKPMSTFLKEISLLIKFETSIIGKEQRRVDSKVLLGMLNERGLQPMADGIKDEARSKEFWSFKEIESALERHLLVGGLEYSKSSAPKDGKLDRRDFGKPHTITLDAFDEIDTSLDNEISKTSEPNNEVSVRLQFVEDNSETDAQEEAEFHSSQKFNESKNYFNLEDTLIINRSDIESQPPGPYPALHTLISQKSRKIFIKKIFRKDGQQYIEFIQRLERQDKWKDAKAIIDSELEKRGIRPYSKEAILLGDVVFSRYFSRK
jgi:hypothetical protein